MVWDRRLTRRSLLGFAPLAIGLPLFGSRAIREIQQQKALPGTTISGDEYRMAQLVNLYRAEYQLPEVPLSTSLTEVAQLHVRDLANYDVVSQTDQRGLACSLHSWSTNGEWTPVCYTRDNAYAEQMWNKPYEITHGIYSGYGFEIAMGAKNGYVARPDAAVEAWKNSPLHNAVMINSDSWAALTWRAMGVGIYQGYAVVWFGEQTDPQGAPQVVN
jgi:hypothetical protein